jgi:hypothetical protein
LGVVLELLTTFGLSLSPVRDVAGELRHVVDHGEEDEGVWLLFYRRGMVGWSGLATWACSWAAASCRGLLRWIGKPLYLFSISVLFFVLNFYFEFKYPMKDLNLESFTIYCRYSVRYWYVLTMVI